MAFALQLGTCLDNIRHISGAGAVEASPADVAFFWVCDFTHEVLCAVCPAIGFQLMAVALLDSRQPLTPILLSLSRRPWIPTVVAWVVCVLCFVISLVGFISVTASDGTSTETEFGVQVVHPVKASPFGLMSVFVYSFLMVAAGITLSARYSCRQWSWLVAVQVAGIVGQAFGNSLGAGYHFFASNFWEQVTIGSSVLADAWVNEGSEGWLAHLRLQAPHNELNRGWELDSSSKSSALLERTDFELPE